MIFNRNPIFQRQPIKPIQVKDKKRKCEVVVEKTSKGTRRRIQGECSPAELKALMGADNLDEEKQD